ncbi:hypothetical protein N5915_04210 [Arcobacter lacus]|uniref:hypothetical protein n=1 Tax=Arcobacter lacus TaxID=1912876 RepID=UPI0021BA7634|nr:hypothetical protein [Arcobacter lacus]MCT7908754.1 hypothetical protein [Arcobacter lacus]
MKALDLLKEQYNILNNGIDGIWINPKKLDEAIKELEELQSRSCGNCKYNYYDKEDAILMCTNEDNNQEYLHNSKMQITLDFSCNKWEVKNECS